LSCITKQSAGRLREGAGERGRKGGRKGRREGEENQGVKGWDIDKARI